ncbi:sensor histidine kinase [Pseudacidovorax intermedius]|uniref:sensor histidine kinase n=1 Tax=Pseudacidovorax intermedius TaxID=433924 RepID=UPI000734A09E|nr:sensor histidine kinase [Pseudacidovorax intermedius]
MNAQTAPAAAGSRLAGAARPAAARARPSLRARVLRQVMLPLALTWLAGTLVVIVISNYFVRQAFDRALVDDAYAIAANIQPMGRSDAQLQLTAHEMTTLLFDQHETVYFAVRRPDGSLLSGDASLPTPFLADGTVWHLADVRFAGKPLRAVVLRHPAGNGGDFIVVVAQTTGSRTALLRRLGLYATLPQMLLLAMLAWWLWRGIARELAPLGALQQDLGRRDASDLSPVAVRGDTREVAQLGDALNDLFVRLDGSVRAQREFAGNVAHELRTPLAGIRALAHYGLGHTDPAVAREQLQRIADSEARASHLVDQLLALALAAESDAVLQREPVVLDQLAHEAVLRHLTRADARGVDLGARGLDEAQEAGGFTVPGSVALVEGILDNLIDNALRYGGKTVTIELAKEDTAAGPVPVLSVADDGPGIAEAQQQALMHRWAQGTDGRKLGEGSGLGLSIVARYAKLLGAELRLSAAAPTGGLRVSVLFVSR